MLHLFVLSFILIDRSGSVLPQPDKQTEQLVAENKTDIDTSSLIRTLAEATNIFPQVPGGRPWLPEGLISPEEYWLQLDFDVPKPALKFNSTMRVNFSGTVEIRFVVQTATKIFYLHSHKNLTISDMTLRPSNLVYTSINDIIRVEWEQYGREELKVAVPDKTLWAKKEYILHIAYSGSFGNQDSENTAGLFWETYNEKMESKDKSSQQAKLLIVSDNEPVGARKMMPCFDEPRYKAVFHVKLVVPKRFSALSNAPLLKEIKQKKKTVAIFSPTMKMSSYLLTVALTEYPFRKHVEDGRTYRLFATAEQLQDQANFSLNLAPKLIRIYETIFQFPLPGSKLDFLVIPNFKYGAMENVGLITFSPQAILMDNLLMNEDELKSYVPGILSHELVHQWLGNIVTASWWSEVWLNEGLTAAFVWIGLRSLGGFYESSAQVCDIINKLTAMDTDISNDSIPLVWENEEPVLMFTRNVATVYQKGAAITRMLQETLGNRVFLKGMQAYVSRYQYSSVKTAEFWRVMQSAAEDGGVLGWQDRIINISEFLYNYTYLPGYPLVTVERHLDHHGTSIHISQQRYKSLDETLWKIPLTLRLSFRGSTYWRKVWLIEREMWLNFTFPNDALIFAHENALGYYRVTYDKLSWEIIAQTFLKDKKKVSYQANAAWQLDYKDFGPKEGRKQISKVVDSSYIYC